MAHSTQTFNKEVFTSGFSHWWDFFFQEEKKLCNIYLCCNWTISPRHMRVLECLITLIKYARSITGLLIMNDSQAARDGVRNWMEVNGTDGHWADSNHIKPGQQYSKLYVPLWNNCQCNAALWLLPSPCLQGIQSYWSSVAPSLPEGSLSVFPSTHSHK